MKFKKSRWIPNVAGVWGEGRGVVGDEVRKVRRRADHVGPCRPL